MRLLREEPPSESCVTPSPAATVPPNAPARASILTPVHFLLARALPRLWQYANRQPEAADRRALRRKLRELMSWALTKEGHPVQPSVATLYRHEGENVQGRLELLVGNGNAPLLAIESDWLAQEPSLLKLEAWHRKGVPALWIVGRRCEREMLYKIRSRANRTLHQNTLTWLAIYHLDHGWVWAGSAPSHR